MEIKISLLFASVLIGSFCFYILEILDGKLNKIKEKIITAILEGLIVSILMFIFLLGLISIINNDNYYILYSFFVGIALFIASIIINKLYLENMFIEYIGIVSGIIASMLIAMSLVGFIVFIIKNYSCYNCR